ncbi:hypothetical protein [Mesorhizobium sp. M0408]|uniref:hypothetical protein n=1 Tax=Mesorhizobium sp. M0408 TaxID=2956942 RepID=UPI00333CB51D
MTQSGHHFRGAPETGINIACSTSKRKQQRWQDFSARANRRPLLTATHPSLDMPTAHQIADVVRMKRLSRDGPSMDWTLDLYKSTRSFWSDYDGIPKRSLRREVVVLNRATGDTSAKTA